MAIQIILRELRYNFQNTNIYWGFRNCLETKINTIFHPRQEILSKKTDFTQVFARAIEDI